MSLSSHEAKGETQLSATEDLSTLASADLYAGRQKILGELGLFDLEIDKRAQQKRIHLTAQEAQRPASTGDAEPGKTTRWTLVSPAFGFGIRAFEVFRLSIPPNTSKGRYHVHGDAVKYYLSGHGVELVGDDEYEVGPGDFIHLPAGVWHGTQNPNDEPIEVLAVQQWPGTYSQVAAPFIWGDKP